MSNGQEGKKKRPEFGKRGGTEGEQPKRKPGAMERLKKAGSRWLGASGLRLTKEPRVKGFKRSRLRP